MGVVIISIFLLSIIFSTAYYKIMGYEDLATNDVEGE